MARQRDAKAPKPPESRRAPEPEGPEEIYRRFERLNRRRPRVSLGGLGRKPLYVVFGVVEVVAIVLGFVFEVPFMDAVAIGLPGLLTMMPGLSKDTGETKEETSFERLLKRLGDPGDPGGGGRSR